MQLNAFSSYDEPLGPRSGRYFGSGYKNVAQDMFELEITRSTEPGAKHSAVGRLSYPADWSTKKHRELVPHVSSIDTVMLAVSLCDAAISHTRNLSADQSAHMLVRHTSVRAGTTPHENLDRIPVDVEVVSVVAAEDAEDGELETTFRFQVGNLAGTLTMAHPTGSGATASQEVDRLGHISDIYGTVPHYFLNGLKNHTLSASDLTVNDDVTRITGKHWIAAGDNDAYAGAESAYWDTVSPIDAIIGAAQLSQILLYKLDHLDRSNSNTLWMRKLELVTVARHPAQQSFEGTMEIRRTSLVERGGKRWRSADIVLKEFAGATGSCLLAHQLPD
ncbi:AvrD family protein [Nocardia sp. NPDC049149]|uniref:AvrD family protein n=1 Tax=Nocardia sp. NPDC049149 TaxID=3364315 RepID=UPI00372491F4